MMRTVFASARRAPRELHWTFHARSKMRQYGLSEARVRRVIHTPARIEEGIAPKTIAVMQKVKGPKKSYEIWVLIEERKKERRIVSAWRYPGETKPGEALPDEIRREFVSAFAR